MRTRTTNALVALLAAFLSVGLVLAGPARPALAIDEIDLGTGGLTVMPVAPPATPGGGGLLTVVGDGLGWAMGAGMAGFALFSPFDSWLPWGDGGSSDEGTHQGDYPLVPNCANSLGWVAGSGPADDTTASSNNYVMRATGGCAGGFNNFQATATLLIVCQGASGTTYSQQSQFVNGVLTGSGTQDTTVPGCGTGTLPVEYVVPGFSGCHPSLGCGATPSLAYHSAGYAAATKDYTVNVTCRKDDGSTAVVTLTTTGNPKVPSCNAAFGGNSHGEVIEVSRCLHGIASTSCPKVGRATAPTSSTTYADCVGANKACPLRIYYQGNPCGRGDVGCVDWATDRVDAPGDYECHWGPYTVPMVNCYALERAYKASPKNQVRTGADTDGDPNTKSADAAALDGDPAPSSTAAPVEPLPTTGPNPGTATPPDTSTDTNSDNCWGTGWSWNPVSWVVIPVKCSLTWAFVPPDGELAAELDGIRADWNGSDMGGWNTAVGGIFGDLSGAGSVGDCVGPTLTGTLPGNVGYTVQPLKACAAPMSTVAGVVNFFIGLVAIVGGLFAAVHMLGAALGMSVAPPTWQQGELF